ncbi:hypothetical protein PHYPSEUDO_009360 [Phytophthora pseudosyringae]|uniref:Transmembrane protein n=1 Tax=Phytophthora pseudosyringae TaxID=221518 RepID=A0A8T1W8J6_9STRA|nr:hypothetical protein PHYPSEUDO_009360 [Phytophthora pseudosyringae]
MPTSHMSTKERFEAAWMRFYDWKTEHQFLGRYSVDKLQQFDRYQGRTTLLRCLGVICLLSILPVFALLVGLHAIPLSSPDLGVQHNIGALGLSKECRQSNTILRAALVGGLVPEGLWTMLSWLWRYPVPGNGLVKLAMTLGCIIFLGCHSQTKASRALNRQRRRILITVMTGYLMIVLFYLLLALTFARSPWGIQLGLIIVQPPLRSLIKRQSWIYARKLNDLSTDVTLNIVDMSASMHQALCVQYTSHPELAALILFEDFCLAVAVAYMYATHTFIVDGYRTLQTAIKIVEGSLPSALVLEECDEIPSHSNVSQQSKVGVSTSTEAETIQTPKSRLHRVSSDTVTNNSKRATRQLTASTTAHGKDQQPSGQRLRRAASSGTNFIKPHRLQRRLTAAAGGSARSSPAHEPPLSPTSVQPLRRTASGTVQESKYEYERPTRLSVHGDATRGRSFEDCSRREPRLQSWARGPSKVYCLTDLRPEVAPPSPSLKQSRPSQGRHSSIDLPPLGDLHSSDGFGRRPPLRRSTSVFLTPRILMRSGSKRLLDLGRSTGQSPGNAYAAGETPQTTSPTEVRRPTQINIDGMLVVRKDQARILEQTLQLLFSCEVLVVTEFVKVLVPLLQGLLLATLWNLPSSRYNILLRDTSKEKIVERMLWCLCYAAFELPALVVTCVVVFKKYGISPLHLLSFLVEQQFANFQTKLTSCFIALLLFTSVHQGMDWMSK